MIKLWVERLKKWYPLAGGASVSILALVVLIGWYFRYEPLIRLSSNFPAMVYNTALLLFLLGASQIFLSFHFKVVSRVLAIFVVLLAFLIGFQHATGLDVGVDQFFFKYNLDTPMDKPGRMAFNTSICLFLIGISLFFSSLENRKRYSLFTLVFSCLVISIAGVSFFGYLTGLESVGSWAHFYRMAMHTAAGSLILGSSLLVTSLTDSFETGLGRFAFPVGVLLAVIVGTFAVWQAFRTRDFLAVQTNAEYNAKYLKYVIEDQIVDNILDLNRMAERWSVLENFPETLWEKDVQNYLRDIKSLLAIQLVNPNLKVEKSAQKEGEGWSPSTFENPVIQEKLKTRETFLYFDFQSKKFFIFIPFINYELKGTLVATFSAIEFLREVIRKAELSAHYAILFQEGQAIFYSAGNLQSPVVGSPIEVEINPALLPWKIKLFITELTLFLGNSGLGKFILGLGMLFALFATASVYFGIGVVEKGRLLQKNMEELKEANQKAQEATLAKGLFLANMSHEIRTPLNAVIGTIQLLGETQINETQKKYIDRINNSSRALLALINDILDFSKIESGTIQMELAPVSLEGLFKGVVQGLAYKASQKKIDLLIDFPAEPFPMIQADHYRLQQVVSNLINNALKFTEKGYILLRAIPKMTDSNHVLVRIEVEDTGIGISQEDKAKLFQKFSQIESSQARKFGGIGLGLSICKRLVEMMGGKIDVTSESGKGSTFWTEISFATSPSSQETRGFPPDKGALLLDPKEKEREIVAKVLQKWGLKVFQNRTEGPCHFAIVPEEASDQVALAKEGKLPILLVTDRELETLPEGVFGYLSRPLVPTDLYAMIQKTITG